MDGGGGRDGGREGGRDGWMDGWMEGERERAREGVGWRERPDLYPVLAVVRSHECLQFVPALIERWPLVDLLRHSLQETHWDVAVEETEPLQQKLPGVLHSLGGCVSVCGVELNFDPNKLSVRACV